MENCWFYGIYDTAGIMGLVKGKIVLEDTASINNTQWYWGGDDVGYTTDCTKSTEPYAVLDTTVSCTDSADTCLGDGTAVKGVYHLYPNTNCYRAGYADLYNTYGAAAHDCKLAGVNHLLENSELTHNIPTLENGSGTEEAPYIIYTADDLKTFRDSVNLGNTYKGKFVKLGNDIDLENEKWDPIGKGSNSAIAFMGTFDGDGKTISNYQTTYALMSASTGMDGKPNYTHFGSALFGRINSAVIKNLKVTDASTYVTNANITAAVCGYSYGNSVFEKVDVSNCEISGVGKVGGIVGMTVSSSSNITLKDCTVSNVKLNGTYNVAGLVANMQGKISLSGCKVSDITFNKTGDDKDYMEYDTVASGCEHDGTKVKGLYWNFDYQGVTYSYGAYADLYIKYGSHDCPLAGTTALLANGELVNNLPSVKISDADAYISEDGNGNLRFISDVILPSNTAVTTFGTWIIPANIFEIDNSNKKAVTIENSNLSGDTFAADLLGIPTTELDRTIIGVSYIETEYGSVSSDIKTATVKDYTVKQ